MAHDQPPTREHIISIVQAVSTEEFSRSGGPGGQNVNKVNTQVTLRVPVGAWVEAAGLTPAHASAIREKLAGRINEADELVVQVSDTRSQKQNREIAAGRAADLLAGALKRPRRRRPTRPSAAARERRLAEKRRRSQIKRSRGPIQE